MGLAEDGSMFVALATVNVYKTLVTASPFHSLSHHIPEPAGVGGGLGGH